MPPDKLSYYNKGQQEYFKIVKAGMKRRNKLNKMLDKAIKQNKIYEVMNLTDALVREISNTDKKAHESAQVIIKQLNIEFRNTPRKLR